MAPVADGGGVEPEPDSELHKILVKSFGSLEAFKKEFNSKSGAVKGSGWGWLLYNQGSDTLNIQTTANQERNFEGIPLLTVDVWEHAYYIDHLNSRTGFLEKIWQVVNWKAIAERLEQARKAVKTDL